MRPRTEPRARGPWALGLALGLVVALGAGCVQQYPVETSGGGELPPFNCLHDDECAQGQICDQGLCSVAGAPSVVLAMHFSPPEGSGILPQQRLQVEVQRGRQVPDIQLQPTVIVSGTVRSAGPQPGGSMAASVVASPRAAIPGTSLRRETMAAQGSGFALSLVANTEYQAVVAPERSDLPPVVFELPSLTTHSDHHFELPAHYRRLTGRVVVTPSEDAAYPEPGIAGLRVQAFSESSRSARSTLGLTDEDGAFELLLPPGSERCTLRISPTPESPYYPTVEWTGLDVSARLGLGELALGAGGGRPITVAGLLQTPEGDALGDVAVVTFRAELGNGRFETEVRSDPSGEFKVDLLPGDYSVQIVPPINGPHALTVVQREVAEGRQMLGAIPLRSKSLLQGRVLGPAAEPVAGVAVEALLVGNGDTEGLYRSLQTLSATDGSFALELDPGQHDFTLIPPRYTGMPRALERNLPLDEAGAARDFVLREPSVIHGVLRQPGGTPAPDVQVQVFALTEQGADLVGEGKSDSEGSYVIVLPAAW